ncbi:MAG: ABC transporter ATP-binding protein [Tissierellia bacterium]|nr:ABC transporter ATP-binding protein [Tissierellia bacterium]
MSSSILKYGKATKKHLYVSLVLIFLSTVCNLFAFYKGYQIIKGLLASQIIFSDIFTLALTLLVVKVIQAILLTAGLKHSHIFAYSTLMVIRRVLTQKMANNPMGETLKFSSGYIRQKLVDSVEQLEIFLAHMIPEGIPYFMNFVLTTIFIFIIDWRLGLLLFLPIGLAMAAMGVMQKNGKELMGPYYESVKNMSGNMTEYIRGIEVIKIFNRKDHQYKKIKGFHRPLQKVHLKLV